MAHLAHVKQDPIIESVTIGRWYYGIFGHLYLHGGHGRSGSENQQRPSDIRSDICILRDLGALGGAIFRREFPRGRGV